jgi:hypothetical protein
MATHSLFILARLLHILTATLWVGAAVLVAASVAPAVRATGPAGATVMRHLTQVQKLPYVVMVVGIVAIISGFYVLWAVSNASPEIWMQSPSGRTYLLGAACALSAALIGAGINIPTANRLGAYAAHLRTRSGAPDAAQSDQLNRLSLRLAIGTRTAAVLLVVATSAMAVARYVS